MDLIGFMTIVWGGVYTMAQIVIKQAVTGVLMPILKGSQKRVKIRKIHFLEIFLIFFVNPKKKQNTYANHNCQWRYGLSCPTDLPVIFCQNSKGL